MGKLVVGVARILPFCVLLLVLPPLAAAQCPSQLTIQRVWTQDVGGHEKTNFAPGETIRFAAQLNNTYGAFLLAANGTQIAITTSFFTDSSRVDIPPGSSTRTWNVTAPSGQSSFTVTVRVYDHFCGVWVERSGAFTVGGARALPDLSATEIQYNRADLVPGKPVLFDSGIQNSGSQGTGVFNVRWFVDGVSVGYGGHEGVPANSTIRNGNSQFSWVAIAGIHTIEFAVDVDNHVVESDESNNSTSVRVTVTSAPDCPMGSPEGGFWYVMGHQCFTAVGAYAKMSQPQPKVAIVGVHSLAEIAVINDSSNGRDAIEVGWIVWPHAGSPFFNDPRPHLFVSRTVGAQTKCEPHSGHCWAWEANSGWVAVENAKYHPGDPVTVTSNPEQYGIYYYQGNWWVNYRNEWIGYFPTTTTDPKISPPWPNNRFTQFTQARWFGEVSSDLGDSCTQMGNGTYGTEPDSALITDMGFINFDGSQTQANSSPYVTDPGYYNMGVFTGHSFTYGGLGRDFGLPICQFFPY